MRETILDEAARITSGERNKDYGTPLDNHTATADLYRVWFRRKYGVEIPVDAEDVCWLNILQKISRAANGVKRDTIVDVAGYSRNIEMVQDERHARQTAAETFGPLPK